MLLQALNDQNPAAIDERLATEGVKDWINHRALPEQLDNPIRQFKGVKSITCLTFASLVSDEATVRQLVEAGADIPVVDSRGCTALHYACASDVDADAKVTYLMQHDASQQTAAGGLEQTVPGPEFYSKSLRLAAWLNQADRVRALIDDHGVSVNATDQWADKALHAAAKAGNTEAINVLMQHPACRVNTTDEQDRTALHLAAEEGHAEAVNVLASHPHCDFGIADDVHGDTAADCARRRGHDDIAVLIGAKSKGNILVIL